MQIDTVTRSLQKAFTANANTSSFPSKIPTITEPTNDGVTDLQGGSGGCPQRLLILPYGLGSANNTFDMKVIGWRLMGNSLNSGLWVPTTLCEVTCTVGAATGVAAAPVLNTELFVDTIVMKSEALTPLRPGWDATPTAVFSGDITIYSPADDTVGWLLVNLYGCQKVEFTYDQTSGTPTTNCLIALV